MAKKSNKTAHVLNLISSPKHLSNEPEADPRETLVKSAPEPIVSQEEDSPLAAGISAAAQMNAASKMDHGAPMNPTIKKSLEKSAKNEALSTTIKNNLEKEFAANWAKNTPSPQEDLPSDAPAFAQPDQEMGLEEKDDTTDLSSVTDEPSSAPETPALQETPPAKEAPVETSSIEPEKTEPEKTEMTEDATNKSALLPPEETTAPQPAPSVEESPDFLMINVCEKLVREQVEEYMDRFQVCKCKRCKADVMALALSNLPPKYVVVTDENVVPFISFYEHKYKILLMSELTKACLTVINNPRH